LSSSAPATAIHRCPKCAAYFSPPLDAAAQCPECGIWFRKWKAEAAAAEVIPVDIPPEEEEAPDDRITFYARIAGLAFIAIWGARLAMMDYRSDELGGSFMHNILLPIHEAGHVFFMPLGEFMTILGGSFFQLALPAAIGIAFIVKQRDPFGAAFCLWWTGASLVDLSPYIWDALDPQLVLLGGYTGADGPHDWIYLLGKFGALRHAHGWGVTAHHLGVAMMLVGVGWGARYCWRNKGV